MLVQVLTPPSTWTTRITVTKTSDDNANQCYTLTSSEFNNGAPSIRWIGGTEVGDTTQSDVKIDHQRITKDVSWTTRSAIDTSSDYPSIVVRMPNDSYGDDMGGVYWKSSSSETYHWYVTGVPEFTDVVLPMLALLGLLGFRALRRRRPTSL